MLNTQIKKVLYYIETHLDDALDGLLLAKVAGYSHFHFCRIFKMYTGESLISYTTRLRLERAATSFYHTDKRMIDIALDAGYKTPTGFLKAFKARFGVTPTEYKRNAKRLRHKYKDIKMKETPEIVMREDVEVVFVRALGPYMQSAEVAWNKLSEKVGALAHKSEAPVDPKKQTEALGICHDDPDVTEAEKIRYDAALTLDKEDKHKIVDTDLGVKTVSGGRYATVRYQGSYTQAEEYWYGLYSWIEKNRYEFRDAPAFEKYLNMPHEVEESELLTEIYVPIV